MKLFSKTEVRDRLKGLLPQLADRSELEFSILRKLLSILEGKQNIIAYAPDPRYEVDILPVIESSALPRPTSFLEIRHSARWFFPKIDKNKSLQFLRPFEFQKNEWGLFEPIGDENILPEDADLILIPALGYNEKGFRLGRGGGYYDRVLNSEKVQKKCIGFSFSKFFPVPFGEEGHDRKVGKIITENGIHSFFD
ncbi:5-formyltetrahydrofolate cyclo-ligase [Leptospira sp. 96542]|nr:5-formyltetrahydrofolate cyclo-ligase [Leptospira sp. 96542]